MAHYAQQVQAFVLRLPPQLEEDVRARLRQGGMDGVSLTARPDGSEGLPEFAARHGGLLELRIGPRPNANKTEDEGLYGDDAEEQEQVFPARLVNLPCVVEMHKTVDYVTLFKSGDIGQMVVVYSNETELLEDLEREEWD